MPPVRWKFWLYVTSVLIHVALTADAQQMQDPISVSSDGWRPIVGSRRQATSPEQFVSRYADVETTTYVPSVSPKDSLRHSTFIKDATARQSTKGSYLEPQLVPIQNRQKVRKVGVKKAVPAKYRHSIRGQAVANSNRNEVFVPAPLSSPGAYYINSPSTSGINTREVQGLGLISANQFVQPNVQINYASPVPFSNGQIYQRPGHLYTKPLQNDEYTRNLVPPPPARFQPGTKDKVSYFAFKDGPITDASSIYPQFGVKSNQFAPQVAPIFDYTSQQQQAQLFQQPQPPQQPHQPIQTHQPGRLKEQTVDVQVTKENLKQYTQNGPSSFGSIPGRNAYPIEFVDYDFHAVKPSPTGLPNTLTYEVTEGKWLDTSSQQYQFRPLNAYVQPSQTQQQNNARPVLLYQGEAPPTRPSFVQSSPLNIGPPPFLPTPYRPNNVVSPTLPTQNDASNVFNRVSDKRNKLRNSGQTETSFHFDIKEVSTHYPVVGNPEVQYEGATDTPLPMKDNGEISNDITTQKEFEFLQVRGQRPEPTRPTTTRDPTKARVTGRRRPRPRRPTPTTTEEPAVETYEPIKESVEDKPVETERPHRRRRPRPPITKPKPESDDADVRVVKPDEHNSSKQRGRYRFRPKEQTTESSDYATPQRKRFRPTSSENTVTETRTSYETDTEYHRDNYENYPFQLVNGVEETASAAVLQSTNSEIHDTPFIEEIHSATQIPETDDKSTESITYLKGNEAPENEVDFTTAVNSQEVDNEELFTTTTTTSTTPEPTTTSEASSPRSHRIRVRPNKYDASSRPRFSVKDYKQRLTQLTSTTTPSSTSEGSTNNIRLKYPNRVRTRPGIMATTATSRIDEDATDDIITTTSTRTRFKPNLPRYQVSRESDNVITDNSVKAVTTRLRPFERPKTTTDTPTAGPKISIRPNLFSARRRVGYPSLRNRIEIKQKKNETKEVEEEEQEETLTKPRHEDEAEIQKVAESGPSEITAHTTETSFNQELNEPSSTEFVEPTTIGDVKTDDQLLSMRVSDLTSSFKDYDKPGAFNSVRPTSRSIPNYFTLATEDPKLPIEAFFTDIEKTKER